MIYLKIILLLASVCCIYASKQPMIESENGQLLIESVPNRNITFRLMGNSIFMLNDINLSNELNEIQNAQENSKKDAENIPTVAFLKLEVRNLKSNIDRLIRRLSRSENVTYAAIKPRSMRRFSNKLERIGRTVERINENLSKNECLTETNENPCQNGGVCHDSYMDYHCECIEGWKVRRKKRGRLFFLCIHA